MTTGAAGSALDRKPLLMLMDGHAMVYRAFHAIPEPLNVSKTGEEVRAVYGFLNAFLRALLDWNPTHCAIAFDLPVPTFRHKEFPEYKAQRPPPPPELRPQFARVKDFMTAFGVPIFEKAGFEADDVLGSLCRQAEEGQIDTVVLSGDSDLLQLVSPYVKVVLSYSVQRTTVYDTEKVKERYGGLGPETVPDIKALTGDSSDNIPGVPGVGSKTAIKLLNQFDTIEGIFERLDEVSPPRAQQSLRDNKEQALQGKHLTTIVKDLYNELDLSQTKFWQYDRSKIVDMLGELEFHTIVPRIPTPGEAAAQPEGQLALGASPPEAQGQFALDVPTRETKYIVLDTPEALRDVAALLDTPEGFAFGVVTSGAVASDATLAGIMLANSPNAAWYVPVGHTDGMQIPLADALEILRPLFENISIPKTAHNANVSMTALQKLGVLVENLAFDTMLAAHIGGRKSVGLASLALECLGVELATETDITGTGRKRITMAEAPIGTVADYACAEVDMAWQLQEILGKEAEEKGVRGALDSVEMPLVPILVRMQVAGVALDSGHLEAMADTLGADISRIQTEMYELVGHEFNIGSSQQLGGVLFDELHLPPTKRTKTGHSTDASSLEGLKHIIDQGNTENVDPKAVEVLDNVLEYRQLTKIKSTYVDALPAQVNPATGRIHTSYQQTGSATGRVSSHDPNVQNIPVRTELGRQVRKAFVAERAPEWTLLAADYSQIELRILAHLSQDPGLLEAFRSGLDIHSATASSAYGVAIADVTEDMRRIAKIMNFGVVYGLSPFGISRQTGLSADEGKAFTESYFGQYPGIQQYIASIKDRVAQIGYVETLVGRRRYIPEIKSGSAQVRAAGERMAVNMPIQGTAADIIKLAMIRIQHEMDARNVESLMIIQVHDELIFEVPRSELDAMKALVLELMPAAMNLAVPLDVDLKSGDNWGEMN
jgi:DNA polymerase-1